MFPVAGIEVVLSAKNPGGAASTGSISGSVLLTLRVPAVFRHLVLLILSILGVLQDFILRGAVILAVFQGFLRRRTAG